MIVSFNPYLNTNVNIGGNLRFSRTVKALCCCFNASGKIQFVTENELP